MKRILLLLTFFLFAFTGYSQSADIVVTNTDNKGVYVPGTQVVYNISVTNFGPNDATNVEVINELPTGITTDFYWEGSDNSFGSNIRLYDRIPTLKVGQIVTFTIKVDIPLTFTGNLVSTTTANSVNGVTPAVIDPNNTMNSVTDTDIKGNADITVLNTDNTSVYVAGQIKVYTITVTNNGPTDALNIVVNNIIPNGIFPSQFSWTGTNGSGENGLALNDVIDILPNGETVTYTMTFTVPSTFVGLLINKTEVFATTEDPTTPNSSKDTDEASTGADLVITNTDNQDFYIPGQLRTDNIKIKNNGLEVAQAVHVTNAVPLGTTMTWLGDGGLTGSGALDYTIPSLANGAEFNFTVKITVPLSFTGDLISETVVTSTTPDPNPNCDTCKDVDKIQKTADIVITNTNNQTLYNPGDTVIYTVTVKNNGPDAATNINLTDVFPAGIAIVNWSGTNGSNGGSTFSDTIATLANGATVTYTITVKIPTTFSASLVSTVNVTSDSIDSVPACANCTDTDIMRKADIVVTNTDNQSAYILGGTNTYTVTVKNNGPDDATNVTVTNGIPAGITQFSWTGSNGSNGTNTALNNTIALLPNGATVTYTITLQIPPTFTGSLTSQTVTASLVKDPVPTCVACIDTDILAIGADIVVTNTDNKTAYTLGGVNTYTVTVTNNGPQAATNVNVINALPAGVTAGQFSWTGPNNPIPTAGSINETLPLLNVGQSVVYTIALTVPSSFTGNLTNTASAASITAGATPAVPDPNPTCIQCSDIDIPPTTGVANVVFAVNSNQVSATVGTSASFTLTVTNNGTQEANTVHVTNPFPTGITTMNWVGTNGSSGTGMLDNTITFLPAGTTITYTITVQIPLTFTGNITDISNVTSLPTNATCTSPSCVAITPVTPVAAGSTDVSITISEALISPLDSQYIAGKQRDYTITVKNNGSGTATGVLVKSNIPSGIKVSDISWTGNSLTNVGGPLNNTITTLASGASMIYHLFVKVPSDFDQQTNLIQQVTVTSTSPDPIPSNGTATDINTPTPYADLVVMKTDNKSTFDQSRKIDDKPNDAVLPVLQKEYNVYTVSIFNYGPSVAKNVVVTDLIPVNPVTTNAQITQTNVTWTGSNGTSGIGDLHDTINTLAVGENVTYTITVYIPEDYNIGTISSITNTVNITSGTPDPQPTCPYCTDVDTPNDNFLFVSNDPLVYAKDGTLGTLAKGFVEDVLVRSHCADVSNFKMNAGPKPINYGVAYFNKKNSDFPIKDGIVISCGDALKVKGPNTPTIISNADYWTCDDISDLMSSTLSPPAGINDPLTNSVYLKFNFIPSAPDLSFNFIFAAEEYTYIQGYECQYADVFAFILKDLTAATPPVNLAILPNTTTPVKVTTIHPSTSTANCTFPVNENYFGKYNFATGYDPLVVMGNTAIALNGQTKLLQAKGTLIPGHQYSIQLIIANAKDNLYNSAVFIEGGSFNFDAKIVGDDGKDDYGIGNEVCNSAKKTIKYGDSALSNATYTWAKNGVKIAGETNYSLEVSESGIYTCTLTFSSGCKKSDDIEVLFTDPLPILSPSDLVACGQVTASYNFKINNDTNAMLSSVSNPGAYEIYYYENKLDAEQLNPNYIPLSQLGAFQVNGVDFPKKLYVNLYDSDNPSGCYNVREFNLKLNSQSGTISYINNPYCIGSTNALAITKSPDLTAGGTYTVTTAADPTTITPNITIDPITGVIDLTTSNTSIGNYKVYYTIPADPGYNSADATSGCPEFKISTSLVINDSCAGVTVDLTKTVCLGDTFNLNSYGTPPTGTAYSWSLVGGTFTSSSPNPVNVPSPTTPGVYEYRLVVTIAGNPRPEVHTTVTVLALPVVAFTQAFSSVCTNNPVNVVIQGPALASVTYKENGISHTVTLNSSGTYTIVTTATSTTYNYELVSSQYGSTPSCTKTYAVGDPGATSTVNVGLPDATIAIQGASPICSGSSSTVRISGTIGASVAYKKDGTQQSPEVIIGTSGYVDVPTGTLTADTIFELTNVATTGTNSCSKAITGQSVTITVVQLPTVTGFTTTTPLICSGDTGTLNFTGTPNSTLVFTDQANTIYPPVAINASGSGTATTLVLTTDTTFKLVSITMTASPFCSNNTILTPGPVTITVNPLPTVSAPAPAAITLCEGEAGGTLSVTANGTAPFTYQWYQGSTPYAGGTGSTLNLAAIASNAGSYTCEVTDKCGKKVPSASATVTVTAKPVITQQPQTTQPVVCSRGTIDITMTATPATGATYQWFKEIGSVNSPITGNATATTNHLVINSAQVSDSGNYSCVVTTCGAGVTSSILTITVNPLPEVTGFSAVASSVCKNKFGQLVFTGTPGAKVYYTVGSTPYGPVTLDAVTGIQTITHPVAITASTTFTLASVSTTGTPVCTNTTFAGLSPVTIDINALPVINSQPSATPVCEGDPDTVLSVSAPGAGLQYEWKLNSGPATIGTNSTLNVPSTLANNGNSYHCIVTDACGQTVTSSPVTITVTARPVITQDLQVTPVTICKGSAINLTIMATPSTGSVSYQWYREVSSISSAITGNATASTNNLVINNAQVSDSAGYYCVVTTCASVQSLKAPITVSPLPEVTSFTTSTASTSVCYNTKGTLEFAGTPDSEIIYKDQTGALYPPVTTNAAGNATVSTPDLTVPMTYTLVSITMKNAPFCSNTTLTQSTSIAIKPDPVVTIATSAETICEGDASIILDATVTAGTGTGPFTYQWKKGTNVVAGATGSTLTLTSQSSNSGSYTCTVTDDCTRSATSAAISILINVKPTIIVQPIGSTICSKVSIDLRVSATPAGPGLTYEWQFNLGPISGNPTATTSNLIIANAQVSDSGSYTCIVRNGTCETRSNAAVMTVNQAPVISQQPKAKILCEGDSYTLEVVVTGGTNVTYQWYKDGNILVSETTSTLELNPAAVSQTGQYYCIVSSASCLPETSDKVKVTVKPLPTASITEGPTATICEGSSSEVVFSGTPNAVIIYTINNGPQRTIILDPYGQAVLLTGILTQTATYTLVKVTENDTNACSNTTFGSSQAVITVIPIISPELKDGYICVDTAGNPTRTYLLDTGLKATDGYTFVWTLDGLPLTETGETLIADRIGKYRVEVTNTASGCKGYAEANVQQSSPPTGITVNISGFFAENATVVGAATPLPTNNYVYRLDDGPYQESPVFQGVAPGEHVIYAWDTQFCGTESSVPFSVIGYPRFFTPNGDGINDTWKIDNDSFHSISNARIFIFDRFGKLIKEISTVGEGWDGTFNSTPLPADDYWFSIKYEEQGMSKEFKAHFALKR